MRMELNCAKSASLAATLDIQNADKADNDETRRNIEIAIKGDPNLNEELLTIILLNTWWSDKTGCGAGMGAKACRK